tara:strand:+ start:308 stop:439 length:132 start_codon:yes stop_codon:yes gene_type:complete
VWRNETGQFYREFFPKIEEIEEKGGCFIPILIIISFIIIFALS